MASPAPPPSLNIPASNNTVNVSIIDTTTCVNGLPVSAFMQHEIPGAQVIVDGVSYAFIVKRNNKDNPSKYDALIFDLETRKDFDNGPKVIVDQAKESGFSMSFDKDVKTTLEEHGEDLSKIGGIVWSHYHVDHTGDPSKFPTSTALIVGPGFKKRFVPGWPTNEYGQVSEKAWEGRELIELDFSKNASKIGQYNAIDSYEDGSLYFLDSLGHATGHVCALARTSAGPAEYILMGGDVVHHGGEIRPSQYIPLPEDIKPNPLQPVNEPAQCGCVGSLFQAIHPNKSTTEPYTQAKGFFHENVTAACQSAEKLIDFDAQEDVFVVFAHDKSLVDVIDVYPKSANEWKSKGWKKQSHWRFLRDYDTILLMWRVRRRHDMQDA